MIALAGALCLVLGLTAALHLYWAVGGSWPAADREHLPATVIGTTSAAMPPAGLTLCVAVLIAMAGVLPLIWTGAIDLPLPRWLVGAGMGINVVIFLVRGLVPYSPLWQRFEVVEPFETLNRRYFSPLIIALGLGFLICLVMA